ncbi:MAG: hypothetical protein WAU70_09455 [Flavobacteriales bacterium]
MPAIQHDHLHRLIHSLDRAEKRYFKVYTSRHLIEGHSNYQLLFDAIADQEVYDEAAILKKHRKDAFTNRFAISKHRLYDTLLRSLDAYHAESSADARLRRMLHHVEILYKRALYPEAEKMLHSVRRAAMQHGRSAILVAVREWECRFMENANYTGTAPAALRAWEDEGTALRDAIAHADALWLLKSSTFKEIYRKGQARDDDRIAALRKLLASPLLQRIDATASPRSTYLFHHIHSAIAFAMTDPATSREHLLINRALIENHYDHFCQEPNLLLSVLSNLAFVTARLGSAEEALAMLKEFREAPATHAMPENEDLDLKLFTTSYSLELGLHCRAGEFRKAFELLPRIERGLEQYAGSMGPVRMAGFYFQMAYAAFGAGETDAALRLTNKLLNDISIDQTEEPICYGRLLHLILLFETGRTDLLPYALRNTSRFLQTRNRDHRTERLLIGLVQSVSRTTSPKRTVEQFQRFHDQLVAQEENSLERVLYDHLDPIAWAASKITGKPFAEIVRERALRPRKAA